MITFGAALFVPKFLPKRVIDCVDTIGRLGGKRAVTSGTPKLIILELRDDSDWAETTTPKAPPEPDGDLQITLLDEIQSEDCIEVLRSKTFKDI